MFRLPSPALESIFKSTTNPHRLKPISSIGVRRAMSDLVYPTNPATATDLLTALPAKFEEARQSGQLFFFPSQAKDIYSKGKRVCPNSLYTFTLLSR